MKSEMADVRQRVRAWALEQDQPFDVWRPRWDLQNEVPGATQPHDNRRMTDLFAGQVQRALYELVEKGVLVKVNNGRDARYMKPEVLAKRQEEAQRAHEAHAAKVEKYRALKMELAGAHFLDISSSQLDIRLSQQDWERLIDTYLRDGDGRLRAAELPPGYGRDAAVRPAPGLPGDPGGGQDRL
jgi:hypothetical protein